MKRYRIVEYEDNHFELHRFDSKEKIFQWPCIIWNKLFNYGWDGYRSYDNVGDAKKEFENLVMQDLKRNKRKKIKRIL